MFLSEKEHALNLLLEKIKFLNNQIEDTLSNYYIPFYVRINGITIEISICELFESIISDYKNIVLKDYYDELERSLN